MPHLERVAYTMSKTIGYIFPSWMTKHPGDYMLHFVISAVGVVVLYYTFTFIGMSLAPAIVLSSLVFVVLGIGKEILDDYVTSFSFGDLAADAGGILLGAMIVIFLLNPKPPG